MMEVFEKKEKKLNCNKIYKYKTKNCPKMWVHFALKTGWLKINVRTNLGPQISMYLSALAWCDLVAVEIREKVQ